MLYYFLRFFYLMVKQIDECTPYFWTEKETEKLNELVDNSAVSVNWNVVAAVMQAEGLDRGPTARECSTQYLSALRSLVQSDKAAESSTEKESPLASTSASADTPWTEDEV